jgi:hypothetical protein
MTDNRRINNEHKEERSTFYAEGTVNNMKMNSYRAENAALFHTIEFMTRCISARRQDNRVVPPSANKIL